MKKLAIIFLLFTFTLNAQITGVVGVDIANATKGGTVNSRAVDFQLKLYYSPEQKERFGVFYERFDKLNFETFGWVYDRSVYPFDNLQLSVGAEWILIHRWKGYLFKEKGSDFIHWSYGGNAEAVFDIGSGWGLGLQFNYRNRADIDKWVGSTFFNIHKQL